MCFKKHHGFYFAFNQKNEIYNDNKTRIVDRYEKNDIALFGRAIKVYVNFILPMNDLFSQ